MSRFLLNVVCPALGGLVVVIAGIVATYRAVDRALGALKW